MLYPYEVLGVGEDAGDEEIRKVYLERLRQFPPEKDPEMFSRLNTAYGQIKHELARARLYLFDLPGVTTETGLAELVPESPRGRQRLGVDKWLNLLSKPSREAEDE